MNNSKTGPPVPACIESILEDVIARRADGEVVPDADVLAAHPDLADALSERLQMLRSIHLAMLEARRSRLDEETPADSSLPADALPRVPGYAVLSEIGRGGQASVYLAVHEITGRKVALKITGQDAPVLSSRQRVRFGREADVMAAIDHPHVVKITDRGFTPSGALYLAMDHVDGAALDDWIAERRTSSAQFEREVAAIFRQVALAVHAVHELGIVHRDLKPTNVRVDRHGTPHVLDFGLARVSSLSTELRRSGSETNGRHATITGQVVGSLPWASPEQAAGRIDQVDRQSDVYSLGVMLYEAISGEFPYRVNVELRQLLENIATVAPLTPIRLGYRGRPPCSSALEAVILKMMAKDRSNRYGSAKEVADELDRWLGGRPVLADLSRQRRRRYLTVTTSLIAVLISMLGFGWFAATRPSPPRLIEMPTRTNGIGMSIIRLPPGSIILGSPLEEPGREQNERQWATQIDRPFWMSAREVTRGQYRAVMGTASTAAKSESLPSELSDDLPMTGVSWLEAAEFCRRLSEREQASYRLPTEAEWEYAARAGTQGPFVERTGVDRVAWHQGNSGGRLHPVGMKWANHWGFFDMHGNAAEWCRDPYGPVYPTSHSVDQRISEAEQPRVVRGGSAERPAEACRSAAREPLHPDSTSAFLGFRVVMEEAGSVSGE